MKPSIGIITLNAKFIHSSLSLRYLRNAARNAGHDNVWIREFTIQQPVWKIAAEIQKLKPDILGVSIYIWNRARSFELIEYLKKQNPELQVAIGGPEVSFEPETPSGCTVISGEGESKWVEFLDLALKEETPSEETLERWSTYGTQLPELQLPYLEEDFPQLQNRYAYLETSRGCPYTCSFCLSALDEKVRYFDEESLFCQINQLISAGVTKFKFVDRTFNLNPKRMKRLMEFLSAFTDREFHFEVVGDILSDDMKQFLSTVPKGIFQFEIGIQTTEPGTNTTLERKQNNNALFESIKQLVEEDRIHIHCDLIFGLPGETQEHIWKSFEDVMKLKPHELQLGFLKFLPGAPVNSLIEEHDYQYLSYPPYEIISHRNLSADEVLHLKQFTEAFDLYYNSKRFQFSIHHLLETHPPVEVFNQLLVSLENRKFLDHALSLDNQYGVFYETFEIENNPHALDLLKLDYLYHQRTFRLPEFLRRSLPSNGKARTWEGDRKTPLIPFHHEIHLEGGRVRLTPLLHPVHYAVAHPAPSAGYLRTPTVHKVDS